MPGSGLAIALLFASLACRSSGASPEARDDAARAPSAPATTRPAEAPAGAAAPARPAPAVVAELSAAELAAVEAAVPGLHAGMSEREVQAALGVDLRSLPTSGQGGREAYLVMYRLRGSRVLGLTWSSPRGKAATLVAAEIVDQP